MKIRPQGVLVIWEWEWVDWLTSFDDDSDGHINPDIQSDYDVDTDTESVQFQNNLNNPKYIQLFIGATHDPNAQEVLATRGTMRVPYLNLVCLLIRDLEKGTAFGICSSACYNASEGE